VICFLVIWYTLIVTVTFLYLASLIQALIRGLREKTVGHKVTDSLFFILVRIQDFLLSLMITVVFYRLAMKKQRESGGEDHRGRGTRVYKVDSITQRK
jgi:hypothetical protein